MTNGYNATLCQINEERKAYMANLTDLKSEIKDRNWATKSIINKRSQDTPKMIDNKLLTIDFRKYQFNKGIQIPDHKKQGVKRITA